MTKNGVSTTTAKGQEQHDYFKSSITRGQTLCQYDYRHTDGQLFSCVRRTLSQCRFARNRWLINEELRARQTEILLSMRDTIDTDTDEMVHLSGELDEIAGHLDGLDAVVFTANI